jgi:hypothetical protein
LLFDNSEIVGVGGIRSNHSASAFFTLHAEDEFQIPIADSNEETKSLLQG